MGTNDDLKKQIEKLTWENEQLKNKKTISIAKRTWDRELDCKLHPADLYGRYIGFILDELKSTLEKFYNNYKKERKEVISKRPKIDLMLEQLKQIEEPSEDILKLIANKEIELINLIKQVEELDKQIKIKQDNDVQWYLNTFKKSFEWYSEVILTDKSCPDCDGKGYNLTCSGWAESSSDYSQETCTRCRGAGELRESPYYFDINNCIKRLLNNEEFYIGEKYKNV